MLLYCSYKTRRGFYSFKDKSLLVTIHILELLVRSSQGCEVITKCIQLEIQFDARHFFKIPYSYNWKTNNLYLDTGK